MSVDIRFRYFDKNYNEIEAEDFGGRNGEWFDNISNRGNDWEYDDFPTKYLKEDSELGKAIDMEKLSDGWAYDFRVVEASDFKFWYGKRKPFLKAGWLSRMNKWKMENKNYIPSEYNDDISYTKDDVHTEFVEWIDPYDCSDWLYDVVTSNLDITYIVYYFG